MAMPYEKQTTENTKSTAEQLKRTNELLAQVVTELHQLTALLSSQPVH